ncbi:MAG TPA: DMT family transporter [Spirochaetota bacterium]
MRSGFIGGAAILFSCVLFACTSFTVKYISSHFSGMSISFARFVIGGVLAAGAIAVTRKNFRIIDRKSWLLRGVFGAVSMGLFYIGIHVTSSGRATLFADTYPVFVALFGILIFGEKVAPGGIAGVALCLAGSVIVFYDGSSYPLIGNILCIGSAVTGGIALHYLKKSREYHNSFLVYLSPCIIGAVMSAWAAPELVHPKGAHDLFFLFLVGLFAFAGQVVMSFGYRYVTPTQGSIVGTMEILFSVLLSNLFLHEEMTRRFFVGGAFILAGLVINQGDFFKAGLRRLRGK